MAPFIAVVADDLTGSGDTAVQFVRAGWPTQLSVGRASQALADPAASQAEVIAVTTHSRPLPAPQAAAVVGGDVAALRAAGVRRLYKKVDSTLRGAFKAEIDAARHAWRDDAIAVVCPAFPATGRTVRDGVLYVDGRPVTETSAATDPVTPVTESHIPTLLGGAQLAVIDGESARALADRILAAGTVVVVDAQTPADMDRLAHAIVLIGERALPVGSGGLAAPLARLWAGAESRGAVIVVVTSQHSAARRQAAALQVAGAQAWSPTLAQLADDAAWRAWSAQVCRATASAHGQPATLLLLAPEGRRDGLDSDKVAARLGELAGQLIQAGGTAGVVATGGDGASAVLAALQAGGIALVDEVTGGVPLGTLTGGPAAGLPIVTKAGGFGTDDVLIRAASAVRERRFQA
ncbi:D-threonate kinase [Bordetella sp. BOR01]|uniref:D-threonate kinase n=1 Tax=Bordetella sp. BOR01 TaxID=2854779 RepID=UPI001C452F37|nr:D-threonate kinase [Bordetella sp. BOR01]MBV7482348.1 four-carbon acid sugar kinase family protein [Bordetella sp. BOR01]